MLSTSPEQNQLQQGSYAQHAHAIHALQMMWPYRYAFGSVAPLSHLPTIPTNLYLSPPVTTSFAPLFLSTTPCQYPCQPGSGDTSSTDDSHGVQ